MSFFQTPFKAIRKYKAKDNTDKRKSNIEDKVERTFGASHRLRVTHWHCQLLTIEEANPKIGGSVWGEGGQARNIKSVFYSPVFFPSKLLMPC